MRQRRGSGNPAEAFQTAPRLLGQGDKLPWRQYALLWMLPPHQCLGANHNPAFQLRLVVENELLRVDRQAKIRPQTSGCVEIQKIDQAIRARSLDSFFDGQAAWL